MDKNKIFILSYLISVSVLLIVILIVVCVASARINKIINYKDLKENYNTYNENYVLPYTLINKLHTTNNLDILDPDYVAIKDLIDLTETHLKSNKHISTINPIGTIIYIKQDTKINPKNYLNYITDLFFTKEEEKTGNIKPVYGFILNTTTGAITGTSGIKNNILESYHEVYVLCNGVTLKGNKVFELYKMLMAKADSASTDTNSLIFNIPNLIEKIIVINTNEKNIIDDKRIKTDFDNDIIYSIEPITDPINMSALYKRYLDTDINPDMVDKFLKYKDYGKNNDNEYVIGKKEYQLSLNEKNPWLYKSNNIKTDSPSIEGGSNYRGLQSQYYKTLFNDKYKDDINAKLHYLIEMPGEINIDGKYVPYENIADIIDEIRNTYNDDAAWINTFYTRQYNNPLFRRYYNTAAKGYDNVHNRLIKNYYSDANLKTPPLYYKSLVGKKNSSESQNIYNDLFNYRTYDGLKYNYSLPKFSSRNYYPKESGKYNILTLKDIDENKIDEIKQSENQGSKTFDNKYDLTLSLQEYKNRGFTNYNRDKSSLSTTGYNILKGGPLKSKKELQQILGVSDNDMKAVINYDELKNNFIVIAETDNNNEPGNLPDNQYLVLPFIKVL